MKLICLLLLTSCGWWTTHERKPSTASSDVRIVLSEKQAARIALAGSKLDGDGLLPGLRNDCDGILWMAQYAAMGKLDLEPLYEDDGRWYRRPEPRCWNSKDGDVGSKTTWSRDMFICGLLPYALLRSKGNVLLRHETYGERNAYKMGEPLSDGRVLYTPNVIKLLKAGIEVLTGKPRESWLIPTSFSSGLTDYEAHLQMCRIWAHGWTEERRKLTEITDNMFDHVKEQYEREASSPFYAYLYGTYSGDYGRAISLCSLEAPAVPDYLRCSAGSECVLAHYIFSCGLLLDALVK